MNATDVLDKISHIVKRIIAEKGMGEVDLTANTVLLDGSVGIDSLDLAVLVRELEDIAGFDPFQDGFIEFHTAGELAELYVR